MDWISFKKQKLISQLFFESLPQVVIQSLLFFSVIEGKEFSGVTERGLIISISSALVNCIMQIIRLCFEKTAVRESFVEYAFNCISARFGWIPFQHQIEILDDSMEINYDITYDLPIITLLTQLLKDRNDTQPLQIGYKHGTKKTTTSNVEFDFSSVTINKLISTIKNATSTSRKQDVKNRRSRARGPRIELLIKFGKSLRLLDVRSIISLMQTCSDKFIRLPDIHNTNWKLAFHNSAMIKKDVRLHSNTFDNQNRSLLISLYLTGYDNNGNHDILKSFIRDHDVPINGQDDKGNTVIHYMIKRRDYGAIEQFLDALKPDQKLNLGTENDRGHTIFHEFMNAKPIDFDEVTNIIKILQSKGYNIPINITDDDGNTLIHHMVKQQAFGKLERLLKTITFPHKINYELRNNEGNTIIHDMVEQNDYDALQMLFESMNDMQSRSNWNVFNNKGESALYLAITKDQESIKMENEKAKKKQRSENAKQGKKYNEELKQEETIEETKTDEYEQEIKHLDTIRLILGEQYQDESTSVDENILLHIAFIMTQNNINQKHSAQIDQLRQIINANTFSELTVPKSQIVKWEKQKDLVNNMNLLHLFLITQNPDIKRTVIAKNYQTIMGYVLSEEFLEEFLEKKEKKEDSEFAYEPIIKRLLDIEGGSFGMCTDLNVMYALEKIFVYVAEKKGVDLCKYYFDTFEAIRIKLGISPKNITDKKDNNPLHHLATKSSISSTITSHLCKQYPVWMTMVNDKSEIPLYTAIKSKNIDIFYSLIHHMMEIEIDVKSYLKQKSYVKAMIEFGSQLLQNQTVTILQLLLSAFDYEEIFKWSKSAEFDSSVESDDISLIKYVSQQKHQNTIHEILFDKCLLDKEYIKESVQTTIQEEEKKVHDHELHMEIQEVKEFKDDIEIEEEIKEETKEEIDEIDEGEAISGFATMKDEQESIDWIELAY
eukprot:292967_1